MGQGPFEIMLQSYRILRFWLLVGWVTSITAESEKTILCTSSSGNEAAVCGPVNSIPNHLICNLEPAAVSLLSQNDALALAQRIKTNCMVMHGKCQKPGEKGTLPFQVAASLVSKFEEFSPEILYSLGQVAVGLSVRQIDTHIRNAALLASLPSLSRVRGWDVPQAEAILRKLFSSGYQIQDGGSLAALGSLVVGLDHHQLQMVPPQTILDALKLPGFTTALANVSPTRKMVIMEKLIAATDGVQDLVKYIPDELTPYLPKSLLVPGSEFGIQDLSCKPWTHEQAEVFFGDVIKSGHNFSSLCASILQGFNCAAANKLDISRLQELAKAMKEKNVLLGKDQLLCLVNNLMRHGVPRDFTDYPEDMVLFVSPSDYGMIGSCKEYFAHVGKANIDVLDKGSPQRKRLLEDALDCLKISGSHVSGENAKILGRLVCDLGAEYFRTSGKHLLKQLTECQSFDPDQAQAIRTLLCSGNTPFGPPSEWSSSTLEELSSLFPIFDHCILKKIPMNVLKPWLKCFLHASHLPRKELAAFLKNRRSPRHKRSTDPPCPVTDEMAQDDLMPIYYTAEELRECLTREVFIRNLDNISYFAFADEQLAVMKEKLDETGYPESVLRNLGDFMALMGPEDIKKWKFNSSEILASLLAQYPSDEQAAAIIRQYTDSGGPLNAEALDAIGTKYICRLDPEQLRKIDENAIREAKPLDISNCTQTTKEILYQQAKRAFSDQHNSPEYYQRIKPYLEGAPGEDLKALSKDNVNMDIETFMKLNKDAIMQLTPSEVKGLLGRNLLDLKNQENNSPVKDWIVRQKQSELDKLGIGLKGGTPEGYMNIMPRSSGSPETSGAPQCLAVHLFPSLLLTLLLTCFLS